MDLAFDAAVATGEAIRISDLATANEILISADVSQRIEGSNNLSYEGERLVTLKGMSGEHRLVAVNWR